MFETIEIKLSEYGLNSDEWYYMYTDLQDDEDLRKLLWQHILIKCEEAGFDFDNRIALSINTYGANNNAYGFKLNIDIDLYITQSDGTVQEAEVLQFEHDLNDEDSEHSDDGLSELLSIAKNHYDKIEQIMSDKESLMECISEDWYYRYGDDLCFINYVVDVLAEHEEHDGSIDELLEEYVAAFNRLYNEVSFPSIASERYTDAIDRCRMLVKLAS